MVNFISSLTGASLPRGGAALTAPKTSKAHDAYTTVTRWHARTCRAVVRQQTVFAPSIRHTLTLGRRRFRSSWPAPTTPSFEPCYCNTPNSCSGDIEKHSWITASSANANGSLQTTLSKLPFLVSEIRTLMQGLPAFMFTCHFPCPAIQTRPPSSNAKKPREKAHISGVNPSVETI